MWIWNCTHAPSILDRRWLLQVMVGVAKAEVSLNVFTCLLQGLGLGSVGQYWPGGTVEGCGGSGKQPTLWWTPSHRTFKAVCNGPSPLLTEWLFSSEKLSPLKFQATLLATCWYRHYVIQLSKKFSPSSSHSFTKDVISPSVCKSSRRMGRCLILWHTKIANWERKPWQGWTGSQKEK